MTNMHQLTDFSLQEMTSTIPGVIYQFVVYPDGKRQFTFISAGIQDLLDITPEEVYADYSLVRSRIHTEDKWVQRKTIPAATGKLIQWRLERRIITTDETIKWVEVKAVSKRRQDRTVVWNGIMCDITERKQLEQKVELWNSRDQLTCLPNRYYFIEQLDIALGHAKRKPENNFAVLYFGLDRFSFINDSFGHVYGDELLRLVAERLRNCVDASDSVARISEDKFAILLHKIQDIHQALRFLEHVKEQFNQVFLLDGHELFVTATAGLVLSSLDYHEGEEIFRDAHSAMHRAKRDNRGGYEIFQREMYSSAVETLKLDSEIRLALERNEFIVHYLPIVSLANGNIVGAEALVRWNHPKRGLLAPNRFIAVAEDTGLISKIGELVFKTACNDLNSWHRHGFQDIRLAVNLSARQFVPEDIIKLLTLVSECKVNPSALEFEITETTIMTNADQAQEILEELRSLGIKISIDDFGTGYSSLSYLKRLPCNVLKIDKSFVDDINNQPDAAIIPKAIVGMAHTLGLKVLAEGVETEQQLSILKSFGCDEMQGFLFSPPVTATEIGEMLEFGKTLNLSDNYMV